MIKQTTSVKKTNKGIAITIYIIYGLAAVISMICILTDWIPQLFNVSDSALRALIRLYGYMLLATLPSLFLFLANKAPIRINKVLQGFFWVFGIIGMIGLFLLFLFISFDKVYADILGESHLTVMLWLYGGLIASIISFVFIYILSNFKISFNNTSILTKIVEWCFNLFQGQVIYLIATLICTFFMVLAIALVICLINQFAMFILMYILYALGYGKSTSTTKKEEYEFTNDKGCRQTVYSDNERDFYNSDGSYAGYSDDDGNIIEK